MKVSEVKVAGDDEGVERGGGGEEVGEDSVNGAVVGGGTTLGGVVDVDDSY